MKIFSFIALLILIYPLHGQIEEPLSEPAFSSADTAFEIFEYVEPIDSSSKSDGYTVTSIPEFPTGTLHIVTDLDSSHIFLNGKYAGTGSVMIDTLKPGEYTVTVEGDGEKESATVYVIKGHVRNVDIQLRRHVFFCATHSFSQVWCKESRAFGPSLDLGVQFYQNYLGINFHWDFFSSRNENPRPGDLYNGEMVGGAAVQYYYNLANYMNALIISPGVCVGYWDYWAYEYGPDDWDDFIGRLFGGVSLRASMGYRYVFFNVAYTVLFGNTVAQTLIFGIRANM